jgi:rsbT co-antagonist protein RsbR
MMQGTTSQLPEMLRKHEHDLLTHWIDVQLQASTLRRDLLQDRELREQSRQFLRAFREAAQHHQLDDITDAAGEEVRALLADLSRRRAEQGFSPVETAMFVFSLKQPIFTQLRETHGDDLEALANDTWTTTALLDKLGLYTTEVYQQSREEIIRRQQQELIELSTPVVKLWEGIVAVPLIGILDSARTQVVMENLLQSIIAINASVVIIDITGVPMVDTLVAQHLLKTVAAARLMGADCILIGIRQQIAQTIFHLGVDLQGMVTKATLADAFALALQQRQLTIVKKSDA